MENSFIEQVKVYNKLVKESKDLEQLICSKRLLTISYESENWMRWSLFCSDELEKDLRELITKRKQEIDGILSTYQNKVIKEYNYETEH